MKEDDTITQLVLEKESLENSFNAIKDNFAKLEELENNLYQLRDDMSDSDVNLRDDVKNLSSKLEELEGRIRYDIEDYSNDMNNINSNISTLHGYIDAIKNNMQESMSKSSELEDSILRNKEELENKLSSYLMMK